MSMLELENVHAYYGNIHALNGVSLNVEEGEIVTLIGAKWRGENHHLTHDQRTAAVYPR